MGKEETLDLGEREVNARAYVSALDRRHLVGSWRRSTRRARPSTPRAGSPSSRPFVGGTGRSLTWASARCGNVRSASYVSAANTGILDEKSTGT